MKTFIVAINGKLSFNFFHILSISNWSFMKYSQGCCLSLHFIPEISFFGLKSEVRFMFQSFRSV